MTQEPNAAAIFAQLAAPFDPSELRRRSAGRGRELTYITARTARRRLNDVLGLDGWECKVRPCEQGVVCSITIHLPDGRALTREAMGGYRNTNEDQDRSKSADSDAFKRACVLFRIGEYLYGEEEEAHQLPAPPPDRRPEPQRALDPPRRNGPPDRERGRWGNTPPPEQRSGPRESGPPKTGKALWAWMCEQEERHPEGPGLKRHIAEHAEREGWPDRCFRWNQYQIRGALEIARGFLSGQPEPSRQSSGGYRS